MSALTITGASVVCLINGQLYGRVAGIKISSETPQRATHGLDSLEPYELQPLAVRLAGSLDLYRTHSDGGVQGVGIVPHYADLPRAKYFTIQIVDRATSLIIFDCRFASSTGEQWSAMAKGIMSGSLSFLGLSWQNEVKPSTNKD